MKPRPYSLGIKTSVGYTGVCSYHCRHLCSVVSHYGFKQASGRLKFLEHAASVLGIKEMRDWYDVTKNDITRVGGGALFRYHPSLVHALQDLYPDYPWQPSRFVPAAGKPVAGHWQQRDNLHAQLDSAEKLLGITQPEEWYSVALSDLKELGLPSAFNKRQLVDLLSERYPGYEWEKSFLLRGKFAQQQRLERAVHSLFPSETILTNARKDAQLINPETGDYLELDLYIPSLSLAFEYQDLSHFKNVYSAAEQIQARDKLKQKLAAAKGIQLITIPFWWDGKVESLALCIKQARPELRLNVTEESLAIASPTPDRPPPGSLDSRVRTIPGIGEPSNASFFTRARADPKDWWLFEKYDGVRGFWNPKAKAFFSRQGRQFTLPQHIIDAMPQNVYLDGELWFGRNSFQQAAKISGRVDISEIDWPQFKYMVFDEPNHGGTYEQRYAHLVDILSKESSPFLEVAPRAVCSGLSHLESFLQDIIEKAGEGIILRDPTAIHEPGRSQGFLKHKKFRDGEARVIRSVGTHQWECQLPNGVTFVGVPGTGEFVKRGIPKQGDIVSFKHRGFLMGTNRPKLPQLYRIRTDIEWADVVNNWKEKKPSVTVAPVRKFLRTHKPKGYWKGMDNRRQFFDAFAKANGFAPTDVQRWSTISRTQILAIPGGAGVLHGFMTVGAALRHTYPDLIFEGMERRKPNHFWQNVQNCRNFFDQVAAERGIDSLSAKEWYSVDLHQLRGKSGGKVIQEQYGGFKKALQRAYPEVSFERWHRKKTKLRSENPQTGNEVDNQLHT